jgi:hypothetical protein
MTERVTMKDNPELYTSLHIVAENNMVTAVKQLKRIGATENETRKMLEHVLSVERKEEKDPLQDYQVVLKYLNERIAFNHKRYGLSYLDRSFIWMHNRLKGEHQELIDEIKAHLEGADNIERIRDEAIDVAFVGILMADMAMHKEKEG